MTWIENTLKSPIVLKEVVNQGADENRSIEQTLNIGWELLSDIPDRTKRIKSDLVQIQVRTAGAAAANSGKSVEGKEEGV